MPLNALAPLNHGAIFAGFRIVRSLGSGGMGEVYLIQHPRLPRRDALKILSADLSADPEYRARFNREADLASTLYHPHIVGVHDRGEYNGQLWLSMDFVDGQDAARLLASRYPAGMPVDVVLSIITAVASALNYAHRQGLLHRDVKPANIMLTHVDDDGDQRILLTDFGIARSVDDVSGLTTTNMSVGTVAYSAPEQLMGDEIDGRADQYALAATAYHLLTGLQLFPHSNPAVAISRHLNAAPPVLADTRPELAALDPVLAAALAKNPDQRFASCSDFARAFADQVSPTSLAIPIAPTASAPLPLAGTVTTTKPPHREPDDHTNEVDAPLAPSGKRHNLWLIAGAAAAIAVLLIGTVISFSHTSGQQRSRATVVTTSTVTTTASSDHNRSSSPTATPCTADELARVTSRVTSDTSNYLANHPDVNDFFTSLRGQPQDQIRDQVQIYLDANAQVREELRAIRQPSVDYRNRCP